MLLLTAVIMRVDRLGDILRDEPAGSIAGRDRAETRLGRRPQGFFCANPSSPQSGFELGEGLFDWVQVRGTKGDARALLPAPR